MRYLYSLFIASALAACASTSGQTMTDAKTPAAKAPAAVNTDPQERWALSDIYPTDAAWSAAFDKFAARLGEIDAFVGKLGTSGATLADALSTMYGLDKELSRLYAYAAKRSDEDTKNADALGMKQRTYVLYTDFAKRIAFIEPEVLTVGAARIAEFAAAEPRLAPYKLFLDDTLRKAPHTLDDKGEKLLAATALIADAPSTFYGIFTNAELPWPTITLSDGTEVRLDQSAYTRYRAADNRADRQKVFETFWGTWKAYQQTMGVSLYAQMKKDLFYAQSRNYDTCVGAALDAGKIPAAVYTTLVETTGKNLDTLHRYFKLRGRMLGISDLRYHDIYPSLVRSDKTFPIEDGKALTLAAVAPLGEAYAAKVKEGFANRWMDTYPRPGKRSGAYASGAAYDVHPFVLMNYNDDYESVSTLAHEWGHAMHSYLANTAQPYATADYAIFVAEVASTFNEALLLDHVLKNARSDDERLFYLGSALEGLRGTFFRQTMFAEFELAIHAKVEAGDALTGEVFTEMYAEILKRYHGHDEGVLTIDDAYTMEWAYIPHFYYNFYVYKYATSIAASSLIVEEVLAGPDPEKAVQRYLDLLKAGGSDYPYELLKKAGVDLATPAPYEALVKRMSGIMDEIETILARQGK